MALAETPGRFLRDATADDHARVDAAFARFALDDRESYARFLQAQARATIAVEAALAAHRDLPAWQPRSAQLRDDLRTLGAAVPEPLAFARPDSDGAAYGMLYVLEGSRLGAATLVRQVPDDFPHAFLGARAPHGGWRSLLATIGCAGDLGGEPWRAQAVSGARRVFDTYVAAAATS